MVLILSDTTPLKTRLAVNEMDRSNFQVLFLRLCAEVETTEEATSQDTVHTAASTRYKFSSWITQPMCKIIVNGSSLPLDDESHHVPTAGNFGQTLLDQDKNGNYLVSKHCNIPNDFEKLTSF